MLLRKTLSANWQCFVLLACAIVLQMAPATGAKQPQKGGHPAQRRSTTTGRELFESVCSGCHGLDGRGGERGPDLATRPQVVQLSDGDLNEILQNGRLAAGMPAFGSLPANQRSALVAYIRSLQGERVTAALPGDPESGKQIFFGKGNCSECHMMNGKGGFIGNDLSSYAATHSAAAIRTNILQPGRSPGSHLINVTLPDGRKITAVIRNEDNFSLQLQSVDGQFHFLQKSEIATMQIAPDTIMPATYKDLLTPRELDDLVKFLATASKPASSPARYSDDE